MKYKVPCELIGQFLKVVNDNARGESKEFLAYLIGHKDGQNVIGTELVFPSQQGSSIIIEDLGKSNQFHKLREGWACLTSFQKGVVTVTSVPHALLCMPDPVTQCHT